MLTLTMSFYFPFKAAILSSTQGQRALSRGRVVTINTSEHRNALAVILQAENPPNQGYPTMHSRLVSSPKERHFLVLVICDAQEQTPSSDEDSVSKPGVPSAGMADEIQPFLKTKLFLPERRCSHSVTRVNGTEISAISVRQLKLDTSKIIDDHKKRMLPRFR